MLTVTATSVALIGLAWWRLRHGFLAARYYLLGWGGFIAGVALMVANRAGVVPANVWTENGVAVGTALMLIGFSLAMADRVNVVHSRAAELSEEVQRQLAARAGLGDAASPDPSPVDGLTGLANRRRFEEAYSIERRRNSRASRDLSCLVIDADHFQRINAEFGHDVGDVCLRVLGERIRDRLHRAGDLVARFESETFTILLPNTDEQGAATVAEDIRGFIESKPIDVDDERIELTVSVGVASEHGRPDDWRDLLGAAEAALQRAKQAGRNRVEVAGPEPAPRVLFGSDG
jgi:diguanylate cyclase